MPESKIPPDQTRKSPPRPNTAPLETHRTSAWTSSDSPSTEAAFPPTIARFTIREILGKGAFGIVYRGFDPELHRDVAIKVPYGMAMHPDLRERFLREARAAATIHHPNVCPVYEVGTEGDFPFLVMHFVPGPTLAEVLKQRKTPFPTRHAAAIVRKLALGVAAAHANGVIHRDLKPANILVNDRSREVLITDFGLARFAGEARMSVQGDVLGTPAYMSPEQGRGEVEAIGPLSDVYSLGVILYHLVTGTVPFSGSVMELLAQLQHAEPKPPSTVNAGVDHAIDALCLKAMSKSPADRFPSAKDFANSLADFLRGIVPGDELVPRADALISEESITKRVSRNQAIPRKAIPSQSYIYSLDQEEPLPLSDELTEVLYEEGLAPPREACTEKLPIPHPDSINSDRSHFSLTIKLLKRRLVRFVRRAVLIAALITGLVTAIAVGITMYIKYRNDAARHGDLSDSKKSNQDSKKLQPLEGWIKYASKDGRFRGYFPAIPSETFQGVAVTHTTTFNANNQIDCNVTYTQGEISNLGHLVPEALRYNSFALNPGEKVVTTLSGRPAIEIATTSTVMRRSDTDKAIYLVVIGSRSSTKPLPRDVVDAFFDNFEILE